MVDHTNGFRGFFVSSEQASPIEGFIECTACFAIKPEIRTRDELTKVLEFIATESGIVDHHNIPPFLIGIERLPKLG